MRALIQRVHEACRIVGLPPPHRSTIQRRVDELDALGAARRRGEASLEAEVTPSPGGFHAKRPNDVWQIDHTIVDLVVVDEEQRMLHCATNRALHCDNGAAYRPWSPATPASTTSSAHGSE